MIATDYTAAIDVEEQPDTVFNHITQVSSWWSRDVSGNSTRLHDEFIIYHANEHYSRQKLIEVIPNRKVVWLVTESKLYWLQDKQEWTNTKMVFDIYGLGRKTVLHFTHEGLVPGKECYSKVALDWEIVIKGWLYNFITNGVAIW